MKEPTNEAQYTVHPHGEPADARLPAAVTAARLLLCGRWGVTCSAVTLDTCDTCEGLQWGAQFALTLYDRRNAKLPTCEGSPRCGASAPRPRWRLHKCDPAGRVHRPRTRGYGGFTKAADAQLTVNRFLHRLFSTWQPRRARGFRCA